MIKAPTPPSVASELSARRRLRLTNAVPSHGNRRLGTGVNPECGGVETDPSTARLGGRTRVGPTRSGERLGNCSRGPATSACSPADRDGRGPHAAPALSRRRASSRSDREIGRWLAGASLEATCSWTSSTPCSPRRSAVRPRAAGVHPRRGARNVKDFFWIFCCRPPRADCDGRSQSHREIVNDSLQERCALSELLVQALGDVIGTGDPSSVWHRPGVGGKHASFFSRWTEWDGRLNLPMLLGRARYWFGNASGRDLGLLAHAHDVAR